MKIKLLAMKKVLLNLFILSGIFLLLFTASCKKDKNDEDGGFDAAAQKSYEAVITLQDQSLQQFNGYLQTQDTAQAKESVATWFRSDASVEWATVTIQGVMVKYKNGMCGGLIVDFLRKADNGKSHKSTPTSYTGSNQIISKLPSKKKAIILAAFYDSWSQSVEYQKNNWDIHLAMDGFSSTEKVTNGSVTLDKLTTLNEYGVIDFNTHGVIWPNGNMIQDIVMLTHEVSNIASAKKYWKDLQEGKIILFELPDDGKEVYAIRPDFITKYNDFKKDTILFYGGFCYSGLGHWPDIINSCAAGTYFGVDNTVGSNWAANWAVDIISNLSDHSLDYPMTAEYWQLSSPIPKKYFDKGLDKDVSITYTGYGGLTLWKNDDATLGSISSTETNGAPVKTYGFTCQDYILECNIPGVSTNGLGYLWNYGDGQSYYTVNDNKALYHKWSNQKAYTVSVEVTNINTNEVVRKFTKTVSFLEPSYLELLKSKPGLIIGLDGNGIQLSSGAGMPTDYFGCSTANYETPLTWNDSSFFAEDLTNNDYQHITVQGNVSSDGRILRHCLIRKIRSSQYPPEHDLTLELTNVPILVRDTMNCINYFVNYFPGTTAQSYSSKVEYKEWNSITSSWTTISSIDWLQMELSVIFQ